MEKCRPLTNRHSETIETRFNGFGYGYGPLPTLASQPAEPAECATGVPPLEGVTQAAAPIPFLRCLKNHQTISNDGAA